MPALPLSRSARRTILGAFIAISVLVSPIFAATQCQGTTKEGRQCRNKVANGEYCYLHAPTAKKCAAKTKAGEPCGNNARADSTFCAVHGKRADPPPQPPPETPPTETPPPKGN